MKTLTMITKPLGVLSSVLPILLVLNSAWSAESTPKQKVLPAPGEMFTVEGHAAFVILPAPENLRTNSPIPWVWYAPTFPNLPEDRERWMIEHFREAGIALAGVDVGVSHGSPRAQEV